LLICLKVRVEPGLHLLKLSVHRLLNVSKVRVKVSSRRLPVTTPSEIIPYYRLNYCFWSLSDNKEASR
jgi:hypothetical protein